MSAPSILIPPINITRRKKGEGEPSVPGVKGPSTNGLLWSADPNPEPPGDVHDVGPCLGNGSDNGKHVPEVKYAKKGILKALLPRNSVKDDSWTECRECKAVLRGVRPDA